MAILLQNSASNARSLKCKIASSYYTLYVLENIGMGRANSGRYHGISSVGLEV